MDVPRYIIRILSCHLVIVLHEVELLKELATPVLLVTLLNTKILRHIKLIRTGFYGMRQQSKYNMHAT